MNVPGVNCPPWPDGMTVEQGHRAALSSNSYSRLPCIISMTDVLENWDWLTVLGDAWQTCDNISQHTDALFDCWPFELLEDNPASYRDAMMDIEERAQFAALPDQVTIYRGCYETNKRGLSWTLSMSVAERFPTLHRYYQPGQPLLVRAEIPKARIMAVKLDRNEQEVIAAPWVPKIRSIRHIRVSPG